MRAVIQRVESASVSVGHEKLSEIGRGLVVFLAVGRGDSKEDADYLADKVANLRIFDREGKFDLSLIDTAGEMLAISNFTLYGDARKGRRPSFTGAKAPSEAEALYEEFIASAARFVPVRTGHFQAEMRVMVVNDGPVTLIIDTEDGRREA